jgi:hypothetical protein
MLQWSLVSPLLQPLREIGEGIWSLLTLKVNTIIPLQVEVEAIFWSGHLAISHKLSVVIIESDYKECVQAINRDGSSPWQIQSEVVDFENVMGRLEWWNLH